MSVTRMVLHKKSKPFWKKKKENKNAIGIFIGWVGSQCLLSSHMAAELPNNIVWVFYGPEFGAAII